MYNCHLKCYGYSKWVATIKSICDNLHWCWVMVGLGQAINIHHCSAWTAHRCTAKSGAAFYITSHTIFKSGTTTAISIAVSAIESQQLRPSTGRLLWTLTVAIQSWTNDDSGNVVVEHFGNDEVHGVIFVKSSNKLRSQLFDCVMSVQGQKVTYWLLVITRHEYHAYHHTPQ